jgi:hypothetical protein
LAGDSREFLAAFPDEIQGDRNYQEPVGIIAVDDPGIHQAREHLPERDHNGQCDGGRGCNDGTRSPVSQSRP